MFGNRYYHQTIKRYVALFGTLFNEVYIKKTDSSGADVALIKVPLTYAPKDKMLARVDADPTLTREAAVILPKMSFEMLNMVYDGDRKLQTVNRVVRKNAENANTFKYNYSPVPYNFTFNLYIYVKNAEDGTKILEQILPYFTPDWTVTAQLVDEIDDDRDIPVILNNVSSEDRYDGAFTQRRAIVWTISFTLKGFLFGPIKTKSVIKFATTNFKVGNTTDSDLVGRVTVQPGLLANGQPTTNSAASVAYSTIFVDDDFGFCINTDGALDIQ